MAGAGWGKYSVKSLQKQYNFVQKNNSKLKKIQTINTQLLMFLNKRETLKPSIFMRFIAKMTRFKKTLHKGSMKLWDKCK